MFDELLDAIDETARRDGDEGEIAEILSLLRDNREAIASVAAFVQEHQEQIVAFVGRLPEMIAAATLADRREEVAAPLDGISASLEDAARQFIALAGRLTAQAATEPGPEGPAG